MSRVTGRKNSVPLLFEHSLLLREKEGRGRGGEEVSLLRLPSAISRAVEQERIWYSLLQSSMVECLALRHYSACVFCFVLTHNMCERWCRKLKCLIGACMIILLKTLNFLVGFRNLKY